MMRVHGIAGAISAGGSGNYVGSGVYITKNVINYGAYGFTPDGTYTQGVTPISLGNAVRIYSKPDITTPWVYQNGAAEMGQVYFVTLTRGSSWTTECINNIKG